MLLVASAGLLAYEANFKEKHGSNFTSWFGDRLVGAVVGNTSLVRTFTTVLEVLSFESVTE